MSFAVCSGTPLATAPGMLRAGSPCTKAARSAVMTASFFFDMARRIMSA